MEEQKFCKDCKFFSTEFGLAGTSLTQYLTEYQRMISAKCIHELSRIDDDGAYIKYLVSGEGLSEPPKYKFCTVMREMGECGESAKLFEPKNSD